MKILLAAALVLALFSVAAFASCWSTYVSCSRQCCEGNAGGNFTEEDDGVWCEYGDNEHAYYVCDDVCVRQELNCIAPGSSCAQQFTTCTNGCGGSGNSDCNEECGDTAFDCAYNNEGPSSGGGCCGSGLILLSAGVLGLALFASKT